MNRLLTLDLTAVRGALLILGAGATIFAFASLVDGLAFYRRLVTSGEPDGNFQPRVVVLLPIRGLDSTLGNTLQALGTQRYAAYRVIFIVDKGDPVEEHLGKWDFPIPVAIVHSKPLDRCSGKIAALLAGLEELEEEDHVVVFADSDIVPDQDWLAHLVAPLGDPTVGASTGYRWYFPTRPGLGPALQSAWNSAAGNVMFSERWKYLWGGSCAVRREVLREVHIEERWRKSLSDDMVLTQALKEGGHQIAFSPRATVANYTDHSMREVLGWTNRQACLALLYSPAMSRLTLPYGVYAGSLILGLTVATLIPFIAGLILPAALLLTPVYFGLFRGLIRLAAFRWAMPAFRATFSHYRGWFYLATVLLPFLMLYNVREARKMDAFEWRGKVYRFSSPQDVTATKI